MNKLGLITFIFMLTMAVAQISGKRYIEAVGFLTFGVFYWFIFDILR